MEIMGKENERQKRISEFSFWARGDQKMYEKGIVFIGSWHLCSKLLSFLFLNSKFHFNRKQNAKSVSVTTQFPLSLNAYIHFVIIFISNLTNP
jgi:hypothetical protein